MTTTHLAPPIRGDRTLATDRLLTAGLAAGPVLGLSWLVQGLVRDGYDFTRHPMSLLALGEGGWVQIASFCATGGLMLACAAGLRRVLAPRPRRPLGTAAGGRDRRRPDRGRACSPPTPAPATRPEHPSARRS